MSINFMKRVGALGGIALLATALSGMTAAGATTADPAVTLASLTVTTKVLNEGFGTQTPDSFVYHVYDDSDGTDVLDGIWNHSGKTVIKLPPGTYSIAEDPFEPFSEHVSNCAHVTLSLAHPQSCTVANIWTPAIIQVSTTVDNAGGGTADSSAFHYRVIDTSDNSTAKTGTFNKSGTTKIALPDGTYSVTEEANNNYFEDVTSCQNLTIDVADPAACIIANKFDPHSTTTASNTSSTLPGNTQVTVHGAITSTSSCVLTLDPPLQDPTPTNITVKLSTDAFAQPHKGDPIKLSNTTVTVTTPASLLQTGVDLGIVNNGDIIPEHVTFVLAGVGTTEATHSFSFSADLKIAVKAGNAQPLVITKTLPDTTWTPINATDPVFFSEKSMQLKSKITSPAIGGSVTSIFSCSTPNAPTLVALSAQGNQPPTGGPGDSTPGGGGVTGAGGGGILPVTGTSVWLWLAPAVLALSLGLFAIGITARKRRRFLS